MELISNSNPTEIIHNSSVVSNRPKSSFIEANTQKVSLEHLKNECIIPVFSKDNETTISHYQFIHETLKAVEELFDGVELFKPDIRVSHIIKGRIPSAIGKPAKELLEHEKTIYYERCAFTIEIQDIKENINGNELCLTIGGVRAYNQENLYSKKTLEKFKLFIGFQNKVCTNLCVSTDGFTNQVRIGNALEINNQVKKLYSGYNMKNHIEGLKNLYNYSLTENQFAHLVGKVRMYQHLDKKENLSIYPLMLNDSQISSVVKDYYNCPNFSKNEDGSINIWNLYNLFTEANKSSYIDSNLERNVDSFGMVNHLVNTLKNDSKSWYVD